MPHPTHTHPHPLTCPAHPPPPQAPEVWCNGRAACPAGISDVFAAGVMLFQLLTGRYPFWDMDRHLVDRTMPMYQVGRRACCCATVCRAQGAHPAALPFMRRQVVAAWASCLGPHCLQMYCLRPHCLRAYRM